MKIIKMLLLPVLLLSTSCGKVLTYKNIPENFTKYVSRFEDISRTLGKPVSINNLEIVFVSNSVVKGEYIGLCVSGEVRKTGLFNLDHEVLPPKISIVKEYWESTDPEINVYNLISEAWCYADKPKCLQYYREMVLFHELNHCVRGINGHRNELAQGENRYNSIMASDFNDGQSYILNYNHYIRDLFGLPDSALPEIDLIFNENLYL